MGAIRDMSAGRFAEPWPERPAAKRHERESGSAKGGNPRYVGRALCGAVAPSGPPRIGYPPASGT